MTASDLSSGQVGVDGAISAVLSGSPNYNSQTEATIPNQIYTNFTQQPVFASPTPYFATWGAAAVDYAPFTTCGMRFSSTSPDFVVANWMVGYLESAAIF